MLPILSFFKSWKVVGGIFAIIIISGLIFAGKSYIQTKDDMIVELTSVINSKNVEINQLNNNVSVLNGQINSLESTIKDKEYIAKLMHKQVENIKRKNSAVQKELRKKEKKLVGRDLSKLKDSRHKELVLKIINNSVIKQFKVFEQ